MLGGIRIPRVEEQAVMAPASSAEYPSFPMAGIIREPMAAASATADPEMPPKNMAATTLTWPSPPRMCPTRA